MVYIAHIRKSDGEEQLVKDHLKEVQKLAEGYGEKIGVKHLAGLAGMLHDVGKYSNEFQEYLRYAVAHPEDYSKRGTVDHSTAGGRVLYNEPKENIIQEWLGMIVGNAIISHHGSLGDYLSPVNLRSPYLERVSEKELPEFKEVSQLFHQEVIGKNDFHSYYQKALVELRNFIIKSGTMERDQLELERDLDFLSKFVFSCVVDADRTNTMLFEENHSEPQKLNTSQLFETYLERLEVHLQGFEADNNSQRPINQLRRKMSQECADYGSQPSDILQLSIPTGGGKTLASLRYALKHALAYQKERIIYIVPFTTIIEQNAQAIREVIGDDGNLLEHHSNVLEEELGADQFSKGQSLRNAQDNWDSPIILTTMVQYLNVFYNKGTRNVRRLHNLTKAVVIFDEVQAVPLKCISLFNESLNFLKNYGEASLVLCTATQPALDFVENKLALGKDKEIIRNLTEVTEAFKRVEIVDQTRQHPWQVADIVSFSQEILKESTNLLIILNTKKAVRETYKGLVAASFVEEVYHLSTSMCAQHRKKQLADMKEAMAKGKKIICVSSQLIEAGVDISFNNVIRSLAGVDSIAQAAGRCNRHGELATREVYVINVSQELESTSRLEEISQGAIVTETLIRDLQLEDREKRESINLLEPSVMARYFRQYYRKFETRLGYYVGDIERSLYDLLGRNEKSRKDYEEFNNIPCVLRLASSMKTIGMYFQVIDNQTTSVIAPYNQEAKEIIARLNGNPSPRELSSLLRKAQQYTINIYDQEKHDLTARSQLVPLYNGSGFSLLETAYDDVYGLNIEGNSGMSTAMM